MRTLYFVFCIIFSASLFAQKNIHHRWNTQLKKYVSNDGIVNYKEWGKNIDQLKAYINTLESNPPNENTSKEYKLAYWINAYNALTIDLIIKNYPLKSIKEIKFPWKTKCFNDGKNNYSLGDIEHKILRKMNEPRIHFAINCASKSCPKLLNEAYIEKNLNNQLNAATKEFLIDSTKNIIKENKSKLSKIFLWFGKDFGSKKMIKEFISEYSGFKLNKFKIDYLPYNWDLNE